MCTDVDRNDKSRVCEPGSVEGDRPTPDRILRRSIPYRRSRRGLQEALDSPDAFLSHMWAVTVIGAPKSGGS
jgi:anthranilate synthase